MMIVRLYQGTRSIEEYHKEMEMNLVQAQIRESEEATMAWFLYDLNRELKDVVEFQQYKNLHELVHQAIKGPKKRSENSISHKACTPTAAPIPHKASSIKCVKCLGKGHIASKCSNRCVMIIKDGKIRSESSTREASTTNESNDVGSFINVASERLVKKLALPTTTLWLSEKGDLLVDKKVGVTFSLSVDEDRVVFDVVPMEVTHLLLWRPWYFDRNMIHDGATIRFTILHLGLKVVLKLVSKGGTRGST
ncbi:hypothetical protein CR513_36618, partial [Mucuna pruriens]